MQIVSWGDNLHEMSEPIFWFHVNLHEMSEPSSNIWSCMSSPHCECPVSCPRMGSSNTLKGRVYAGQLISGLTLTTLWADSADDKLIIFFLFFLANWIWHFIQMKCLIQFSRKNKKLHANCLLKRQFAWSVISNFLGKIRKIFQNAVCWNFYPACKGLITKTYDRFSFSPNGRWLIFYPWNKRRVLE